MASKLAKKVLTSGNLSSATSRLGLLAGYSTVEKTDKQIKAAMKAKTKASA